MWKLRRLAPSRVAGRTGSAHARQTTSRMSASEKQVGGVRQSRTGQSPATQLTSAKNRNVAHNADAGKVISGRRESSVKLDADTPSMYRAAILPPTRSHLAVLPPIPLSPDVGGLRQAALWQPRPRTALSRAVYPPCRHLQPPARHGDRRRSAAQRQRRGFRIN
jgi:hypothetical protein